MMKNITIYLIIVAVVITIYMYFDKEINEPFVFSYDLTPRGPSCLDCCYKTPKQCLDCGNCGVCKRGPFEACVPGDENGAYFKELCDKWTYRDHNEGKTDTTPVTTRSRSWNWFYPATEMTRWSSPVFRATLGN